MKIIGKRLRVKPIEPVKVSVGGIELPASYREDKSQFRVLSVGSKVTEIVPGDAVLTNTYGGNVGELPDGTQIIDMEQVVAIISST